MKRIIIALFLAVISLTIVNSQDWNQFRGKSRDAAVTGFNVPDKWPETLNQVWKVTVGTGDATPALAGGRLYLNTRQGNNEVVLCLDAATGRELWRNEYPSPAITGPAGSHPGPRSTPAVAGGKVVTYGGAGILSCIDAKTGKLLWRKDNPAAEVPQFYTSMSPLIAGQELCLVHTGSKDKGVVALIDMKTGDEKWKWQGEGPSYASPSAMKIKGKQVFIVQTEKSLVALDAGNGELLWRMETIPQNRFYNCVSPYTSDGVIYVTGQGTGMKAYRAEEKEPAEIWSNPTVGAKWNTPVLKDGYLYGFSDQKRLYCIEAATGKTAWTDNTLHSDFATLVDCGKVLIGLPVTGNLLVFRPDPAGYSEVARYKVAETPVYSFPVVSGDNIYIKEAEHLTLYKITK